MQRSVSKRPANHLIRRGIYQVFMRPTEHRWARAHGFEVNMLETLFKVAKALAASPAMSYNRDCNDVVALVLSYMFTYTHTLHWEWPSGSDLKVKRRYGWAWYGRQWLLMSCAKPGIVVLDYGCCTRNISMFARSSSWYTHLLHMVSPRVLTRTALPVFNFPFHLSILKLSFLFLFSIGTLE